MTKSDSLIRNTLRNSALVEELNDTEVETLARIIEVREYRAGDFFVWQGDNRDTGELRDSLIILASGEVEVTCNTGGNGHLEPAQSWRTDYGGRLCLYYLCACQDRCCRAGIGSRALRSSAQLPAFDCVSRDARRHSSRSWRRARPQHAGDGACQLPVIRAVKSVVCNPIRLPGKRYAQCEGSEPSGGRVTGGDFLASCLRKVAAVSGRFIASGRNALHGSILLCLTFLNGWNAYHVENL